MSNVPNPTFVDTTAVGAMRPEHQLHNSSEPLPGATGARPTTDYDPEAVSSMDMNPTLSNKPPGFGGETQDSMREFGSNNELEGNTRRSESTQVDTSGQNQYSNDTASMARGTGASATGTEEPRSDQPLGARPSRQGGVAIGERENEEPMGKANVGDKMLGKTQKVVGKMTRNPEMHEKGELREAGGRSAASGNARVPHD